MDIRADHFRATSSPVWTWCDNCMRNTWITFDFLRVDIDGVTVEGHGRGCAAEYLERKKASGR